MLEAPFYLFLVIGAFGQLIMKMDFVAPVLLSLATGLAIIRSPGSLRWAIIPGLAIATMTIIDIFGYPESILTVKRYFVWFQVFCFYLVIHENADYFWRGKLVLQIYILAHFFFLGPFDEDPTRMGLIDSPHMVMGNPSDLAYWCVFAVLSSLAELFRKRVFYKMLYIGIIVAATIVLLLTVSRSAVMFMMICALLFLLLNVKRLGGIFPFMSVLGVIGMLVLILLYFESDYLALFQGRVENEEGSYSGRSYLYDEAIKVFLDSPWLGTGKDEVNPPMHNRANVPHHQYLGLAVHYGVWPALFFAIFFLLNVSKALMLLLARQTPESYLVSTEIFVFIVLAFLISMVSNEMMTATFCAFYMSKAFVYRTVSEGNGVSEKPLRI
jgi:O-antigen ligase